MIMSYILLCLIMSYILYVLCFITSKYKGYLLLLERINWRKKIQLINQNKRIDRWVKKDLKQHIRQKRHNATTYLWITFSKCHMEVLSGRGEINVIIYALKVLENIFKVCSYPIKIEVLLNFLRKKLLSEIGCRYYNSDHKNLDIQMVA